MSDDTLLNKSELGPYRIEKKLGQGAMGGVYMGLHRVLEVHHAIKVIHPKLLGDATLVERFLREARNTAKLKHTNIVQVVGADQVDGIYYLAMEFVQGKTLEQIMRSPGLSIHDAVRYIHMIANALNYAHSRNIIHRDIKPANIMVNEEDVAKLMDFGLVRDTGQPEGGESGEQLTMAGYIMGTPQYMPLEQWQGEGVDNRSDIYALGATLYVALTGKLPFPGKDAREIFRKVLGSQAIDVRTHNPDIDDQLAEVVHTAIAPEKDQRYQKAEEFALALEAWWDAHPYQGTSLFKAPTIDETKGVSRAGTLSSSSAASRTKPPVAPTRAALVMGSTGQGSSPTAMAPSMTPTVPPAKSNAPLIAVIVLVAVIGLAIGAYFVFGGTEEGKGNNTTGPVTTPFKIAIDADKATQAQPLAVTTPEFSIPGEGEATVNGKPYTFGAALTLETGVNELTVAAAAGGNERILYVLLDTKAPAVAVPAMAGRDDNVVPTAASSFKIAGTVSDEGCGLRDLVMVSRVDGDERTLVVAEDGSFEREIPVSDNEITVELYATDRAGNRSGSLVFWLVPDRGTLNFQEAWEPASGWVKVTGFELRGKLSKHRGVTLVVDDQPVEVDEYGWFTARVDRPVGRHKIKCVAEDWLGGKATVEREIVVDLEPPVLTLTAPAQTAFQFEEIPGDIEVAGKLDSIECELKVNDVVITPASDGSFKTTIKAARYGDVSLEVVATDPAGRKAIESRTLVIKRLQFKPMGENEKGCMEYTRLKDGMVMIEIPGGKYTRGYKPEGEAKALPDAPPVEIEVSSFLIARYETTNAQFAKFLTAQQVNSVDVIDRRWLVKNAENFFSGLEPSGTTWSASEGEESLPVVGVTWKGAQAYCQWADPDGSLPTEAQWELSARGPKVLAYPWGALDQFPNTSRANCDSQREGPIEVSKYPDGDSPFGLRHMAGNVEEWCLDWYTEGNYTRADQQGKDPALTDKQSGYEMRVVRGGSYLSPIVKVPKAMTDEGPSNLHTFARARRLPDSGAQDRGFRAASKLPK